MLQFEYPCKVWVCDGVNDEIEINAALASACDGGIVQMSAGNFYIGKISWLKRFLRRLKMAFKFWSKKEKTPSKMVKDVCISIGLKSGHTLAWSTTISEEKNIDGMYGNFMVWYKGYGDEQYTWLDRFGNIATFKRSDIECVEIKADQPRKYNDAVDFDWFV